MIDPEAIAVPVKRWPGAEDLPLPDYHSQHAAGMDLRAAVPANRPVVIEPMAIVIVPCGISIAVPVGYEAQVRPRSGLAARHGISMPNTPGTIDADYRGQVMAPLINLSRHPYTITRGMRIAQLMIKPIYRTRWVEVDSLPPTARGEGGFGSSGQ